MANSRRMMIGRRQKLRRMPWTLVSLQHNRTHSTLDAAYLHDLVLQNITELFNIVSLDESHDVKLSRHLVQFLDIVKLGQGLDHVVHVGRIDENVDESKERSHSSNSR